MADEPNPTPVAPDPLAALEARVKAIEDAIAGRLTTAENDIAKLYGKTRDFITREEHAAALATKGLWARCWAWLHTTWGLFTVALVALYAGFQIVGSVGVYACRVAGG